MTDIVTRLRTWVHAVDAVSASDLMEEAAAEVARLRTVCECYAHSSAAACREIASLRGYRDAAEADRDIAMLAAERLRNGAVDGRETVTCPHVVGTTTQYCSLTPLTLTDAEREAVENAADVIDAKTCGNAATLRGLLERTK
jgi:hypothetical protein